LYGRSLVLVARSGFFGPNGKNNRTQRNATLLALLGAGAGEAGEMRMGRGHCCDLVSTVFLADFMPSPIFFVPVKIA
jgi:hypothetical protein